VSESPTVVIVHDLSPEAVAAMPRYDLSHMTEEPPSPMPPFEFHGCTAGIASTTGVGPWELHTTGDELLHILDGKLHLVVREPNGEAMHPLRAGDLVVVPKGCWHRGTPGPAGVTFLFLTPKDGNRHTFGDPSDVSATPTGSPETPGT
jgi:mannose-6-phosphate isomerase-like protein (cupin superfamily)